MLGPNETLFAVPLDAKLQAPFPEELGESALWNISEVNVLDAPAMRRALRQSSETFLLLPYNAWLT